MENLAYVGYQQPTDDQFELIAAYTGPYEVFASPQGWSVFVANVPGVGWVTTGTDYGGWWDYLLCPPGVTTAAQVAVEQAMV